MMRNNAWRAGRAATALATIFWFHPSFAATTTITSIVNNASNQCLDVPASSTASGTVLIQWGCHNAQNQQWVITHLPAGLQVKSASSGKCMAVAGASTAYGAKIEQTDCDTTKANQLWTAQIAINGSRLRSVSSGLCMDNPASSTTAGMQMIQWGCHGDSNQSWRLTLPDTIGVPVPPPVVPPPPAPVSTVGQWSAKIALPLVPSSLSMVQDGRIAMWSGSGPTTFGGGGKTYSTLFDPTTGQRSDYIETTTGHEFFCQASAIAGDGKLVMTGGANAANNSLMTPTGVWSVGAKLNVPRGYSSSVTTSNNRIFTLGGSWSGGVGGKTGELYTPGGAWSVLANVPQNDFLTADPAGAYRADNHMWLIGASNGWVFHAGPSKKMHWVNTAGAGQVVAAGLRADDGDAMNGVAVYYDVNKIVTMGGAPTYDRAVPTSNAFVIDLSAGPGITPSVRRTGAMAYTRNFANAVVLPTGQVMAVGGQGAGGDPFTDTNSVLVPELWDPVTDRFVKLAPMATPRNYHSAALLLTDGRVLAAGGGQCGGCGTNHPDAEIFSPPYLFKTDGTAATRPTLSTAPANAVAGGQITVGVTGAASFSLVRFSSVTHSVNTDQRRVPLRIVSSTATSAVLQIPADRGVVIPGNYMLFAMTAAGTPSVAKIINIQ